MNIKDSSSYYDFKKRGTAENKCSYFVIGDEILLKYDSDDGIDVHDHITC